MIKKILIEVKNIFAKKQEQYQKHNEFWVQKIKIKSIPNRFAFFEEIVSNKSVLHFGCTDWPIFNPSYNLHIKLAKYAKSIDGFDIDLEGIANLKQYVNQNYYSDYSQLNKKTYDICLIPETIEHVDNVREFLENISMVNAATYYITAPNCFSQKHIQRNFYSEHEFIEVVHPDHNVWYSPYTLKNQIEKYSNLKVDAVFLLNEDTMVCCQASKK
jgi:2-polyprenyl-3-methyl-5-hydroxy-6-metoxy-1,4-benzoquinol methylase